MSKFIAFSGVSLFDGIKFGDVAFAKEFGKLGMFDVYMHYGNYGTFKETDVTGEILGNFKAADYAFGFGWSKQLNRYFSTGANLKGIYSDYYIESSVGLAADIGLAFHDSVRFWTASIVAKNAGRQIKPYTEGLYEPLPAEVQAGVSKGFAHMPFRLHVNFRHCEKWNITYVDSADDANVDLVTGETTFKKIGFFKKLTRHMVLGTEFSITKHFLISASYNLQRRGELVVDSRKGVIGLSFGFGVKVNKFIISYGRSTYHLAGASNSFSVAVNLGQLITKKTVREAAD